MTEKAQRVRGTRDFYPEDAAVRAWIIDAWRRVSLRNGFVEYDGPLLETLDLYRAKSGDELVGQVFQIDSRSGEELAIRPEMTPTLARMINARVHSLPRPIKWFSIGAFYRGERPQRGRLREFLQWNIDIVGANEPVADAECIFVAVDLLRELGLGPQDVVVGINDRRLMAAVFDALGIPAGRRTDAYTLVDKAEKLDRDAWAQEWEKALGDIVPCEEVLPLLDIDSLEALRAAEVPVLRTEAVRQRRGEVDELFRLLQNFGITEICEYRMSVVRGLAYYTGCVFEVFDRAGALRALCGGGRYDQLLALLGGPELSGVGFGMGDVVLRELLEQKGKLPEDARRLEYFVVVADETAWPAALRLVADLRGRGVSVEFPYRRQAVGKQFKAAAGRGARRAIVVGAETREAGRVTVKDLDTGEQAERDLDAVLADAQASGG